MSFIHPTDDLPAYALGILEEAELRRVESHMAGCSICRDEVKSLRDASAQLAYLAPQREPPGKVKRALMDQILPGPTPRRSRLAEWWHQLSPVWGLAALTMVALLIVSNLVLWGQMRHLAQNTPTEQFRLVALAGAGSGAAGHGVMVVTDSGRTGTLVVDGLPTLTEGKQYQLWLIADGKRTNGGVFTVDANGYGAMVINSLKPLTSYTDFGVTIEPAGGSPGPTGEKVLGGSF